MRLRSRWRIKMNANKVCSNSRKKRVIKFTVLICAILSIVYIIAIVGMRLYYQSFFELSRKEFIIPALEDGFVPQGLDYYEEGNLFFISGYICGGEQAKICVVGSNENNRIVSVYDENGNELISHSGGISHSDKFVYLAGCDGICYVISLSELVREDVTSVRTIGNFSAYNQASFCSVTDNQLFIGEYYYPVKYDTDASHHFTTPTGEENCAVVMSFVLDDNLPLGVSEIPEMAWSIPSRVQGISFIDGKKLIMSASSVFQGSQLYVHDYQAALVDYEDKIVVDGREIPVYFFDSGTLLDCIEVLPKSEGIALSEYRLYMIFESASNKFKYGKLLDSEYAYSISIEMLEDR